MNRIAAILIVVGATTSVMAAPFRAISFEAGGGIPNVTGEGFTTSGAGFYNRQGGANANTAANDVTTWAETSTNHSAYDSYFTVSRVGPSRLGSADDVGDSLSPQLNAIYGDATTQASGIIEAPDNHIGHTGSATGQAPYPALRPANRARGGVANQPIGDEGSTLSYINPLSGQDGIFVGQLTVNRGATISGGFLFNTFVALGVVSANNMTLNGAPVQFQTAPGVFQPLVLKSYLVATNDNLSHSRSGGNTGTGSGSTQRFGAADVYHLWVEVVPAPTAVAAFGLAGLAGLRRRRA